jgi:cobalt-precorrin 5A hydrolase
LGADIMAVAAEDLRAQETPTKSDRIERQFGTGSLAEAAALAAAGPGATLLAVRVVSGDGMATAAIAKSAEGSKT